MMEVSQKIMEVLQKESTNLLTSFAAVTEVRDALQEEIVKKLGEAKQEIAQSRTRLKQFHIERGVQALNSPEDGAILYGAYTPAGSGDEVRDVYVWANDLDQAAALFGVAVGDYDFPGEVDEEGEFFRM